MARMYSRKKGKHGSKKPPVKIAARWIKYKKADVEKLVIDLAKERHSSAEIGIILRDQYGIPDVKLIAGKTISKMMRESKNYPSMPEDLLNLLKKAVVLREHLERRKSDKLSQKGLENLESKIRRLGKYYSRKDFIDEDWKYDPEEAKLVVQKK
jgi:small subunit ribosomal protein S15